MNIYNKLMKYTHEKIHFAYISMIFSFISSIFLIVSYVYLWKFLDELISKKNNENAIKYAIMIVMFMLLYSIFYFASRFLAHLLAFRLESNLRKAGVEHFTNASFSFFDTYSSGKIRKIIDDNAADTHNIVAHLIPDIVSAISIPIMIIAITFLLDFNLGILLFVVTVIGCIQARTIFGDKKYLIEYNKHIENLSSETVEYIRGMQVIKIFDAVVESVKTLHTAIMSYAKFSLYYSFTCRGAYIRFLVLFHMFCVCILPFIVMKNMEELYLPRIIFYYCFAGIMYSCFMKVMYVRKFNFQALHIIEKLESLFDDMSKDNLSYGNDDKIENNDIEFENVSFRYEERYVLKNLSFKLQEKKTYALVGVSGSGKSTIAKLISGFYNIENGQILIGGKNITSYTQRTLMNNISFVFQNAKLFNKSIYENVKMGNENATYQDVMKALKNARCDDILSKFKERENTIIGTKGVYLSGGQIQRIAIARAMLKNAPIIILDEASASSDVQNEYEIQQAFSTLMKDKTVIMIAHRLSSIKNVDEILVIDDGKIIERGSHEELMRNNTKYKKLQNLYSQANKWSI